MPLSVPNHQILGPVRQRGPGSWRDVHSVRVYSKVDGVERTRNAMDERFLGSEDERERRIDIHHWDEVHWTTLTHRESGLSLFYYWSCVTRTRCTKLHVYLKDQQKGFSWISTLGCRHSCGLMNHRISTKKLW